MQFIHLDNKKYFYRKSNSKCKYYHCVVFASKEYSHTRLPSNLAVEFELMEFCSLRYNVHIGNISHALSLKKKDILPRKGINKNKKLNVFLK